MKHTKQYITTFLDVSESYNPIEAPLVINTKPIQELLTGKQGSSDADRSAIAIISVVHGAIRLLVSENRFSQTLVKKDLLVLYNKVQDTRLSWCNKHNNSDVMWTLYAIDRWNEDLEILGFQDALPTLLLIKIATRAAGDLLDILSNPTRKRQMEHVFHEMEKLDILLDSDNSAYLSSKNSDDILTSLYKHINFIPRT